jgi:hypothetical protein
LFRHRKEKRPTDQDERLHRSNHIISEIAELGGPTKGLSFSTLLAALYVQS